VTEQDMETRIKAIQEMKRQKIAAGDIKAALTEQEIDQVVPEKFRDQPSKFQSSGSWTGAPKASESAPKVADPAPTPRQGLLPHQRKFLEVAEQLDREGKPVTPRAVNERGGFGLKNPSAMSYDLRKLGFWKWAKVKPPGAKKGSRHAVRTTPRPDGAGLVPPTAPRPDAAPLGNGYAPDYQPGAWPEEPRREDRPAPGRGPERQPSAPASRFSLTDFLPASDELDLEHSLNLANAIRECRPGLRCLLLAFAGELLIEEC
jgi:hypothetical protein